MSGEEMGRIAILLEKVQSDQRAIYELVREVPEIKSIVTGHSQQLSDINGELVVIKDVLRGHSGDIKELKADVKELKGIAGGQSATIGALKAASHSH